MGTVTTSTGIELNIKGISRKVIDAFLLYRPPPLPPEKEIEIYGGFKEKISDYDDPTYKREYEQYVTALARDQFSIIAIAVTFDFDPRKNAAFIELVQVGVIELSSTRQARLDFLRFVAMGQTEDSALIMNEMLYLSTVTQKGIDEAADLFNVTWYGKRVELFGVPKANARFGQQFEDREAARFAGIPWEDFAVLPGPEQSAIVAHYRLSNRLDWLQAQERKRK